MFHVIGKLLFLAVLGIVALVVGSTLVAILGSLLPFIILGAVVWAAVQPAYWKKRDRQKPSASEEPEETRTRSAKLREAAWRSCRGAWGALRVCGRTGQSSCRWVQGRYTETRPVVVGWLGRVWEKAWPCAGRLARVTLEFASGAIVGGVLGLLAGNATHGDPGVYVLAGTAVGGGLGLLVGLLNPRTVAEA
jgi:hypothetical protein